MKNSENKYITCIKQVCGKDAKISEPLVPGRTHPLYIVETENNKTVFRFSSRECADANARASDLLIKHGVVVPSVKACKINGKYCETYPFVPGTTLQEKLDSAAITKDELRHVFRQLIDLSVKISEIPVQDADSFFPLNARVSMADCFFQTVQPSITNLCHTDLNLRNILVNDKNDVTGLLDLDGVTPAHFNTMFARICLCAHQCGLDMNDFYKMYPQKQLDASLIWLGLDKQIPLYIFLMQTNSKILNWRDLTKQYLRKKIITR